MKNFTAAILFLIFFNCYIYPQNSSYPLHSNLSEVKEYFLDIAFGMEYGDNSNSIKKWISDILLFVKNPEQKELVEELNKVINEINFISPAIQIRRVLKEKESNFVVFFSSKENYSRFEPSAKSYLKDNYGFVWIYWNNRSEIYKGSMYVDVERNDDVNCMKHLLREELTQGLGLLQDSYKYSDSIFYQDWSCSTYYSAIDKKILKYFLDSRIKPGMTKKEVIKILKDL